MSLTEYDNSKNRTARRKAGEGKTNKRKKEKKLEEVGLTDHALSSFSTKTG